MTISPVPGDVIATGIVDASDASYSCGTYKPVSDAFSFALFNADGIPQSNTLAVSLEIDKSLVQPPSHPGATSWQICYASTSQFTALPNTSGTTTIGGITYNTGLLPDCSGTQGPPCVQARHKDMAGDVIITLLAPGDPLIRG